MAKKIIDIENRIPQLARRKKRRRMLQYSFIGIIVLLLVVMGGLELLSAFSSAQLCRRCVSRSAQVWLIANWIYIVQHLVLRSRCDCNQIPYRYRGCYSCIAAAAVTSAW